MPEINPECLAPFPWAVGNLDTYWRDSISILDAEGGVVCVLTRGYEGEPDEPGGASFSNAELIVRAVNEYAFRNGLTK